jgi:hypothetical protein
LPSMFMLRLPQMSMASPPRRQPTGLAIAYTLAETDSGPSGSRYRDSCLGGAHKAAAFTCYRFIFTPRAYLNYANNIPR